ncbi:MAG: DUF5668 domain-containing protein [Candidatus Paceibacterota bacterium]|jgi:chromate transport protein ChrA
MENTNDQKRTGEPKIVLFGEEIGNKEKKDKTARRHNHESEVGGLMVLLAGIILVLNNVGVIPWQFWDYALPFWPSILVIIGARIILGKNTFSRMLVFMLAVVVFAFVIIYSLIRLNSPITNQLPLEFRDSVGNSFDVRSI